jgi:hypothetical protein
MSAGAGRRGADRASQIEKLAAKATTALNERDEVIVDNEQRAETPMAAIVATGLDVTRPSGWLVRLARGPEGTLGAALHDGGPGCRPHSHTQMGASGASRPARTRAHPYSLRHRKDIYGRRRPGA